MLVALMPTLHRRWGWMVALAIALLGLCAASAGAQEVAVPVEVQLPLFVKILAFDRHLSNRPTGPLVLGVLYQGKYRTSSDVADQMRRAGSGSKEGAMPLKLVLIDLDDTDDLGEALSRLHIRVLYVSPLRAVELKSVSSASRAGGITTLTGVPSYVADGLSIGIDLKGERPEIVVNLDASRAEGADLDAQLLRLARIVR